MNTLVISGTGFTGPDGYGPVPVPAAPPDLAFWCSPWTQTAWQASPF